jgi:hypothetical protein
MYSLIADGSVGCTAPAALSEVACVQIPLNAGWYYVNAPDFSTKLNMDGDPIDHVIGACPPNSYEVRCDTPYDAGDWTKPPPSLNCEWGPGYAGPEFFCCPCQ